MTEPGQVMRLGREAIHGRRRRQAVGLELPPAIVVTPRHGAGQVVGHDRSPGVYRYAPVESTRVPWP